MMILNRRPNWARRLITVCAGMSDPRVCEGLHRLLRIAAPLGDGANCRNVGSVARGQPAEKAGQGLFRGAACAAYLN